MFISTRHKTGGPICINFDHVVDFCPGIEGNETIVAYADGKPIKINVSFDTIQALVGAANIDGTPVGPDAYRMRQLAGLVPKLRELVQRLAEDHAESVDAPRENWLEYLPASEDDDLIEVVDRLVGKKAD